MVAQAKQTTTKVAKAYQARLKERYAQEVKAQLQKDLGLANPHQVPRLEKIVLNVGLGRAKEDTRAKELAVGTLTKITGQQPVETVAKKSIAGFKLREGQKIGAKVTLRGNRMYEFLDRLIHIVLPRVRDFHGVTPKGFDKNGNYNFGLEEQSVFPELSYDDIALLHGIQITLVTTAHDAESAKQLLVALGLPFAKQGGK